MGRSPSPVREPRVNDDPAEAWPSEIRDYLLGRLSQNRQSLSLDAPQTQRIPHPPIFHWWIFEGKRYPSIGGTLASRWADVIRAARLLERTFNPCLKLSERPEGTI